MSRPSGLGRQAGPGRESTMTTETRNGDPSLRQGWEHRSRWRRRPPPRQPRRVHPPRRARVTVKVARRSPSYHDGNSDCGRRSARRAPWRLGRRLWCSGRNRLQVTARPTISTGARPPLVTCSGTGTTDQADGGCRGGGRWRRRRRRRSIAKAPALRLAVLPTLSQAWVGIPGSNGALSSGPGPSAEAHRFRRISSL